MTKRRSPKAFNPRTLDPLGPQSERRVPPGDQSRVEAHGLLIRVATARREKRQARQQEHPVHLSARVP